MQYVTTKVQKELNPFQGGDLTHANARDMIVDVATIAETTPRRARVDKAGLAGLLGTGARAYQRV